jgi:hypothetical protein
VATAYPKFLYDNRLDDATPAASTTAAGFDVLNLRDWRPYTWWKPTALPATVTVDCGSSQAADYLAVYGHTLGTNGNTIQVRKSTDNFSANDVLVATLTPADDEPFVVEFSSTSSRYWRIRILTGTAPSIAIAALGAAFVFPRRLDNGFDPITRKVKGQVNRSEDGHPLGRVIAYESWDQELSFGAIEWTWLRSTWVPAWRAHLRGSPFIFAWDLTDHADELYLVQAGDEYDSPHTLGPYAELKLKLRGVAT